LMHWEPYRFTTVNPAQWCGRKTKKTGRAKPGPKDSPRERFVPSKGFDAANPHPPTGGKIFIIFRLYFLVS